MPHGNISACPDLTNWSHPCDQHDVWTCSDSIIVYDEGADRYGISIKDGGQSYVAIKYCPFCAKDLSPKMPTEDIGCRFLYLGETEEWDLNGTTDNKDES